MLSPLLIFSFALFEGSVALGTQDAPLFITRLLGLSLLTPFFLGEGLVGSLLRSSGSPRLSPSSVFQFAPFPDLTARIPQLCFFTPQSPFLGLQRPVVRWFSPAFWFIVPFFGSCDELDHRFFVRQFCVLKDLTRPFTFVRLYL
jgi:hypothetical protein